MGMSRGLLGFVGGTGKVTIDNQYFLFLFYRFYEAGRGIADTLYVFCLSELTCSRKRSILIFDEYFVYSV